MANLLPKKSSRNFKSPIKAISNREVQCCLSAALGDCFLGKCTLCVGVRFFEGGGEISMATVQEQYQNLRNMYLQYGYNAENGEVFNKVTDEVIINDVDTILSVKTAYASISRFWTSKDDDKTVKNKNFTNYQP